MAERLLGDRGLKQRLIGARVLPAGRLDPARDAFVDRGVGRGLRVAEDHRQRLEEHRDRHLATNRLDHLDRFGGAMLATERHGLRGHPLRRHRRVALENLVCRFGEAELGCDPGRRQLAGGVLGAQRLVVEKFRHHPAGPVAVSFGKGKLRLEADRRLEIGGRFLEAAEPRPRLREILLVDEQLDNRA